MAVTIAISNQKGGVAKTTSCASLGAALVERDREVLAVDLDPQANLTLALGARPADMRRTVTDVLLGNYSPVSVSRETALPGLDLMPANQGLQLVEKFLHVRENYEHILRRALSALMAYDLVLCDCPPALGAVTLNALVAADLLIIPTQCEVFSAHALNEMIERVRQLRQRLNPRLDYRLLITMLDRRNRIHRSIHDQIRETFGQAVLETAVETDTKLRESAVFGRPITVYAPASRAAGQYRALAEELLDYVRQKAASSS